VFGQSQGFKEGVMKPRQGRCALPPDEAGRILDRLAGLEQIIPAETLRQALRATGRINGRSCVLTHEVMLWVVVAMGVLTELPIRQVFKHARRLRVGEYSPNRSSLCTARRRLGVEPVRRLFQDVVRPLATPATPGAFYRGFRLVGCDGTVFDVPDSDANAAAFHRATGSRGDGAFPQVRKVSLVELGTHVEFAFAAGGWQESEQTLAELLFDQVPTDALLLEDRGFFSYPAWQKLVARGLQLLVRVKSHMVLRPLRRLADGSYLAKIYPTSWNRERDRHGIVVRVIEYTLNDPQRTGHGEVHRLMTTLLDETLYPAQELILLYHERWEEELTYDEQKTHQDPRRATKPANLRSETPEGVMQELYALCMGHFVTRALMFQAATQADIDVDRLSFTGCFQTLKCRLPECDSRTPETFAQWSAGLLWEMQHELTEPRRNRVNPRVIKRKMSKWNKKRAEHRRMQPLRKRFEETVVMVI
jgi:Insertion element 4 transposase N-terminal/Transposase DDE domain